MTNRNIGCCRISTMTILILSICLLPSAWAATLYLVRHAEKQTDQSNPELTDQGLCRSEFLAELLHTAGIEKVMSSDYRRTLATAAPLARRLQLQVERYDPRQLDQLAEQLVISSADALIVGHSNTTPELVRLLGGSAEDMPETDYQRLYQVSIEDGRVTSRLFMMPKTLDPASCVQKTETPTPTADSDHH